MFYSSAQLDWKENSYISIKMPSNNLVEIIANKEGLLSLASHLILMANSEINSVHYETEEISDKGYIPGDLEEDSLELSIVKLDCKGRKIIREISEF